ncbi:TPA: tyrosine--tRNA ligase, partial [bacterium]|nr:tyrosine--tRNA ligase [bacterium]
MNFDKIKKGCVDIIEEEGLKTLFLEKRSLNVKFGVDPTSSDIHLGHTVLLRKLKEFQELGHNIIFIIGDFTARIGDPSGRTKLRPKLTDSEIKKNARTYTEQVFCILSPDKTKILYNSSWFEKMSLSSFINLSFYYTVSRMLERDDFSERFKEGIPIVVAEFLYPILQGYDSFIVSSDIE